MKGGVDHSEMIRAVMKAMVQDEYAELLSELTDDDCREKSKQPADSSAKMSWKRQTATRFRRVRGAGSWCVRPASVRWRAPRNVTIM